MATMRSTVYVADSYEACILAEYERATAQQLADGRAWYPAMARLARRLGRESHRSARCAGAVLSALSPRNKWARNVIDARGVLIASRDGLPNPKVCTFNPNRDKARAIADANGPNALSGRKVESFAANAAGHADRVTIDVWAIRAATGGRVHAVRNDAQYDAVAAAYRIVAALVGERPCDLQAIVWIVASDRGLGQAYATVHRADRVGHTRKTGGAA